MDVTEIIVPPLLILAAGYAIGRWHGTRRCKQTIGYQVGRSVLEAFYDAQDTRALIGDAPSLAVRNRLELEVSGDALHINVSDRKMP